MLQFGVVGYHLYLLHYTRNSYNISEQRRLISAFVTERINQLAAEGCHVTFTDNNVKDIGERSRDAHDVNLIMMDAYLNDGIDLFLLLFPQERESTRHDLQHLPSRSLSLLYFSLSVDR